ncbi:hypothetical protein MTR_8g051900 [Medicago truncatula]|uniref:Uncharacterized protein n=1 Tax=Medicago truncatula TaxID=3880 RepID=G7L9A8_MEDTR|nr:hypothetical protein MTR_8g051900 [Medicago truncatula]
MASKVARNGEQYQNTREAKGKARVASDEDHHSRGEDHSSSWRAMSLGSDMMHFLHENHHLTSPPLGVSSSLGFFSLFPKLVVQTYVESLNAFEKLNAQKKTILKLESEVSRSKEAFQCLRDENASLVYKKFVSPTIESPKTNSPKYDNWMDFASCEIFPGLHKEIKSLNKKLEQVSKGSMTFAMNSKDKRAPFKRPYTKYSYVRKNMNHSKTHAPTIRCHYCGRSGHTTPYCHIRRVEVPKGVMMWVPKVTSCENHSKAPTFVRSQRNPD